MGGCLIATLPDRTKGYFLMSSLENVMRINSLIGLGFFGELSKYSVHCGDFLMPVSVVFVCPAPCGKRHELGIAAVPRDELKANRKVVFGKDRQA